MNFEIKSNDSLQTKHKKKGEDAFANFILPPMLICNRYPDMHALRLL